MTLYNLKEKLEFIEEFVLICHQEWGTPWKKEEAVKQLENGIQKNIERLDKYPTLILLEDKELVGFVSLLPFDCDERPTLTPWYGTLYVKEKYRGNNISKRLTDELIIEAKRQKYEKIYLKTELNNFYDKLGFNYLETISNDEKIYYMDLV